MQSAEKMPAGGSSRFPERSAAELLEYYKPMYLAEGGEHIVYDIPNTLTEDGRELKRDIVFKAAVDPLLDIVERNLRNGREPDDFTPEDRAAWQAWLKETERKFNRFQSIFGREHVVNQKFFMMKVPLTKPILDMMYGDEAAPDIESAWTRVTIQRKSQEIMSKESESFTGGYLESVLRMDDDDYIQITGLLLNGHDLPKEVADRLAVFQWPGMEYWQARLERQPELKDQLVDFISKSIEYSNETGEMLDLFGSDNAIVYETEDETGKKSPAYKLVDAFFAHGGKGRLTAAKHDLKAMSSGDASAEARFLDTANAINYVRMINLWAAKLGLAERLKWDVPFSPKALLRVGKLAMEHFDKEQPDTEPYLWHEPESREAA